MPLISPPSGYTTNYHISKWNTGDTPGAAALNGNWQLIDTTMFNIATTYEDVSLTYAEAEVLVNTSALQPGKNYYLTDINVQLKASSTSTFFPAGRYMYSLGKKAWGGIKIISGAAGSINTITVNGTNILPSPVAYSTQTTGWSYNTDFYYGGTHTFSWDTSLNHTASLVAAAITAGSAVYKAYSINSYIIIEALADGTSANGAAISGTSTTLVLGSAIAMANGAAALETPLIYECYYDFPLNKIYRLYDPVYNNDVVQDLTFQTAQGGSSIFNFPWNCSNVYNNRMENIVTWKSFFNSSSKIFGNFCKEGGFGNNLLSGTSYIACNFFQYGYIINNEILLNSWIEGNSLRGSYTYQGRVAAQISDNYLYNGSYLTGNTLIGSVMNSNSVSNGAAFYSNYLDTVAGIIANTFSAATCRLMACRIGSRMLFAGNTATTNVIMNSNNFNDGCSIAFNTFSYVYLDDCTFLATDFYANVLTYTFMPGVYAVSYSQKNTTLAGYSGKYQFMEMNRNTYTLNMGVVVGFNGTAGHGATGDIIPLFSMRPYDVIQSGFYNNASLMSGSADTMIKVGLAGLDDDCILAPTLVSSLMSGLNALPASPTLTYPTADPTNVVLTIVSGSLTGGRLTFNLHGYVKLP